MEDFLSTAVNVTANRGNSLINRKMILRILGILLFMEAMMFLACAGVSLCYGEEDYIYFIYTILINMAVGSGLILLGRGAENRVTRRDGYCIVAFTWLLFTGFGMLPFYISGSIPSVTDAFFETMSGFTTTGATILDDIEALSHGMLFWRSFSQWIGGLGIVFFTIAVLPIFGVGNQVLFSAEATGVTHDKIHPKISVMAQCLWTVYLVLTVAEIVLLLIGGMDLFDAACHAFSTTATGGYSTKQASVAYWNSPFIEYVIAIFMILSGINFSLYFMCMKGRCGQLFKDGELRLYLISIGAVTLIITGALYWYNNYGLEEAFRKSLFQVASIHTSCGFATDDYNMWPPFTWLLLIYTMVAGGCAGSTAGGVKNVRLLLLFKDGELRLYLISIGAVTLIITGALYWYNNYGLEEAFRKSLFQVASIHTSCGFATDDYNMWPPFTWLLLIYTMVAGGCAGSTAGGVKNVRLLLLLRNVKNEFHRLMHPRAVLPVKMNRMAVSQRTLATVMTFVFFYFVCIFLCWLALMCMGIGLEEAFGLSVSSIGNVGPGLGAFGPAFSWSALPDLAKWLLSFMMLIGRLELFGVLLLLTPSFWDRR